MQIRLSGSPPAEDPLRDQVGVGETRRNSAPELAEKWRRPGSLPNQAPPVSINKQVQRLTQPPAQPRLPELRPHPESGESSPPVGDPSRTS